MIIRWGRKGLVAAAFAVAFVTPSATTPTTIHKADLHPSYKQVVRHVTPTGAEGPTTTIHKVDLLPSYKLVVRHITPVDGVVATEETGGGGSKLALLLREDQEIIDIITAIGPSLVRMV